ncbi:uncharacterized protein LOC107485570 [Arachis duranensis]|uniref:Uncharacterized protein LOC107485570 n=1 Tax=Arachis duranensis TaxID=130453 RepID=A0A9C6WQD8_ARADU|nr:uncharacterized protein LOC107485570 [Arachis duranensis]
MLHAQRLQSLNSLTLLYFLPVAAINLRSQTFHPRKPLTSHLRRPPPPVVRAHRSQISPTHTTLPFVCGRLLRSRTSQPRQPPTLVTLCLCASFAKSQFFMLKTPVSLDMLAAYLMDRENPLIMVHSYYQSLTWTYQEVPSILVREPI